MHDNALELHVLLPNHPGLHHQYFAFSITLLKTINTGKIKYYILLLASLRVALADGWAPLPSALRLLTDQPHDDFSLNGFPTM